MWRQLSHLAKLLQPSITRQTSGLLHNNSILRHFSLFSPTISHQNAIQSINGNTQLSQSVQILQPQSVALNFERGFKVKGRLKRRCKDCYFVMRHERLYVICKTHPRHKQMSMKKKEKNTWLLTDATQSKERAW